MIFRLKAIFFAMCMFPFSYSVQAEVQLTLNTTTYTFAENPRLNEVLAPVAFQEKWYWPATQFFRSTAIEADEKRRQVIEMLAEEGRNNSKYKSTYQSIINQIKSWKIADRISITIDYELSRISAENNPIIEDGHYHLTLSKRPENIYVFGAVQMPAEIPYLNNTCISDIVSNVTTASYSDKSYVYVISPLGEITKAPTAYWNNKCVLPMPGSLIYVPVQENVLFPSKNNINYAVADLAMHRKAIQ